MIRRFSMLVALATACSLTLADAAGATTIGSTTIPSGASGGPCASAVISQATSDPSTPYAMPTSGTIVQWQTNTTIDATAGSAITLVVMRNTSSEHQTVVGADSETLPNPLPAGGIATFNVAAPITVAAGDVLGLYTSGATAACYWDGGTTPSDAMLYALPSASTPTAGQTLAIASPSPAGFVLNASATLVSTEDAGVTTAVGPTGASAGGLVQLTSTVTNAGPATQPITFTDNVPAGLTIQTAVAGAGTCAVNGQAVTCTISGLGAGQSAPVTITALAGAAGSYANTVSVAPTGGIGDPNSANNSATATLTVATAFKCTLPSLAGVPLALAQRLLPILHCKAGKVKKVSSRKVAKGLVIKTAPGAGTLSEGAAVALEVSSGPPAKHKKGKGKGKGKKKH